MGRGLIEKRKHMQRPPFQPKIIQAAYPVLATVSSRYSKLPGRLSTCYSPVRHFTRSRRNFHVRLACVRHAASVQSEPESNSPVEKYLIQLNSSFRQSRMIELKALFPNSLFTCQRTACRIGPERVVPCLSGEDELCYDLPRLSNTFLIFFRSFLKRLR